MDGAEAKTHLKLGIFEKISKQITFIDVFQGKMDFRDIEINCSFNIK